MAYLLYSLNIKHINDSTTNRQQKVTSFFPIRRSARKTKNIVNEEKQIALEKAIESNNEDGLKVIYVYIYVFIFIKFFVLTDSCIPK